MSREAESEAVWESMNPRENDLEDSSQFWAVMVSRNGEEIVTIESNCFSGREISLEDERVIEMAARHLLAFIGH